MIKNVVISGVGGQGLITLGRVVGEALLQKGLNVVVSEVHGLAQRGGSVVIYLRYGDEKVISPIIPEGYGDLEIALELIEALRYSRLLSGNGVIVSNDLVLPPPGIKNVPSRETIIKALRKMGVTFYLVDASSLALEAGSPMSSNIVMAGFACGMGLLPLSLEELEVGIRKVLRKDLWDINVKALEVGYREGQRAARIKEENI